MPYNSYQSSIIDQPIYIPQDHINQQEQIFNSNNSYNYVNHQYEDYGKLQSILK